MGKLPAEVRNLSSGRQLDLIVYSFKHLDPPFTDYSFLRTFLKLVTCVVGFIFAFLSIVYHVN